MYQELHEKIQRDDNICFHDNLKIKSVIKYEELNEEFISKVIKSTMLLKDFWILYMNERMRDVIYLSNLNSSLEKILVNYEDLEKFFNEIQKQFEDNKLIFYIYCCYLKNIINNDVLAEHLIKLLKDYKDNKNIPPVDSAYFKVIKL